MHLNENHAASLTSLRYDADTDRDVMYVHALSHVSWYGQMSASTGSEGLTPESLYKARIFRGLDGYVPYAVWQNLAPAEREKYWSIALGDKICCDGVEAAVTAVRDNRGARSNPHIYLEAR